MYFTGLWDRYKRWKPPNFGGGGIVVIFYSAIELHCWCAKYEEKKKPHNIYWKRLNFTKPSSHESAAVPNFVAVACLNLSVNLLQEGCEGMENRLILHILTRPLCLFILAVFSSALRCLIHSFILALAIPVFLLIIYLKITIPRSTGVLGCSRPSWDYAGSSFRGTLDDILQNPYSRISGKKAVTKKVGWLGSLGTK